MDVICGSGWGAKLERGKVTAASGSLYDIESYDRPGLKAEGLEAYYGDTLAEGDQVYFFLFDDGTGFILGKI